MKNQPRQGQIRSATGAIASDHVKGWFRWYGMGKYNLQKCSRVGMKLSAYTDG